MNGMAAILIVEDDGLVARSMARTLRQAGHNPALASDARSGLREALGHPRVILLDLGLPDLSGEEVLRELRSRPETAGIPVLVITGKEEAAAPGWRAGQSNVAEVLLKPVSDAQLRRAVDSALAYRR
jgi:CheY-like chemotaxis protein